MQGWMQVWMVEGLMMKGWIDGKIDKRMDI